MKRPLKIGIIAGLLPPPAFIDRLLQGLGASGHQILLYGSARKAYQLPGVQSVTHPESGIRRLWYAIIWYARLRWKSPEDLRLLSTRIRERYPRHSWVGRWKKFVNYAPILLYRPDLLHLQWAKGVEDWIFLQEDFGVPLVLSLRGAHINYSPLADAKLADAYRRVFPKINGFHAVSAAIAEEAKRYGARPQAIQVVYSALPDPLLGTPLPKFEPLATKLKLLSVGRLHWKKGYNYALDACRRLKDRGVEFSYTVIAKGDTEELLFQRSDLGLEREVVVIPGLPNTEVLDHMHRADLLLLPSVEEGIANVALEAMAVGLPVVSTDCGGMKEVIRDEENGFIVPVRDALAMADKIVRVMEMEPHRLDRVREAARHRLELCHTMQNLVDGMLRVYRQATETKNAAQAAPATSSSPAKQNS